MSTTTVSGAGSTRTLDTNLNQRSGTVPSYRLRGLDGMRAIAALAVLGYHLIGTVFPGRFLGVDVFFVISGFLITALLGREYQREGRLNIRRFWMRRLRRLFPAVALTVAVMVLPQPLQPVSPLPGSPPSL